MVDLGATQEIEEVKVLGESLVVLDCLAPGLD